MLKKERKKKPTARNIKVKLKNLERPSPIPRWSSPTAWGRAEDSRWPHRGWPAGYQSTDCETIHIHPKGRPAWDDGAWEHRGALPWEGTGRGNESLSRVRRASPHGRVQRWKEICCTQGIHQIRKSRDFPGGPEVKYLPCNAEDNGSILDGRTKVPQAVKQVSPRAATREPGEAVTKDPTWCSKGPSCCHWDPTRPNK